MSWGAFGNALIGGHQAFRMAVADQEERARREAYERRLEQEQAYRRERDTVEDQRYADSLERQQTLDAEARADRTLNRAVQAFEFAQPYGGELGAEQADTLRGAGYGAGLEARQRTAPLEGFGAAANTIAGGGLAPESVEGSANFVRKTPLQIAQEAELERKTREAARAEATDAKIREILPTLDWNNPAAAFRQLVPLLGSAEDALKVIKAQDDLKTNEAQRGVASAQAHYYNARATDPDMTVAGSGGARGPRASMGSAISSDPEFARAFDAVYANLGGVLDNGLNIYGKGAALGGTFDMTTFFQQAGKGQDLAKQEALRQVVELYRQQGKPLPQDVAGAAATLDAPAKKSRFGDLFQNNNY